MRAQEAVKPFVNQAPATSAAFELRGGTYTLDFTGTGAGTVDVKRLGPDGVTFIACGVTQIVATTGSQTIDLPPGQYQAIIAGFTANYLTICRVPKE